MRILWFTWIDPRTKSDGQRIYSYNLIEAVAASGAQIAVVCLADPNIVAGHETVERNVTWLPVPAAPRSQLSSVFSELPNMAHRCNVRALRNALLQTADRDRWDLVVLDGLSTGWALPLMRSFCWERGRAPKIAYVAHNHEESTRASVARNFHGSRAKRLVLGRDAAKAGRLERAVAADADVVTAITRDDADRFAVHRPDKTILVLTPGYDGPRRPDRTITDATPRRVVMVGTFDWIAKQMNLEEFLAVADPLFAANGIELDVVGRGREDCLERVRKRVRATRITGTVPEIGPYLDGARIAVVPERSGGGFKLKMLDYVFNGLPVAAIQGTEAGLPLAPPDTMLAFAHHAELARGVVAAINDVERLNAIQRSAYLACEQAYDWRNRGEALLSHALAA